MTQAEKTSVTSLAKRMHLMAGIDPSGLHDFETDLETRGGHSVNRTHTPLAADTAEKQIPISKAFAAEAVTNGCVIPSPLPNQFGYRDRRHLPMWTKYKKAWTY